MNTSKRKTAFVTGASVGIGYASAVALARGGYDVAVAARATQRLAPLAAELKATGRKVVPIALDLHSLSSVEPAATAAWDTLGGIDVLVNNAGVTQRKAAIDVTPAEWDEVVDTNLKGTFFLTQQLGRRWIAEGRPGCVINMASTHGMLGFPGRVTYGVTKAGMIHMTKMLAIEWAPHRIRVNAIAPGTVETPSRADFLKNPKTREAMLERVPLHAFATAEDVANAVCYLAGDESAYVTGHTLVVDGGLTVY